MFGQAWSSEGEEAALGSRGRILSSGAHPSRSLIADAEPARPWAKPAAWGSAAANDGSPFDVHAPQSPVLALQLVSPLPLVGQRWLHEVAVESCADGGVDAREAAEAGAVADQERRDCIAVPSPPLPGPDSGPAVGESDPTGSAYRQRL